ncbi:uncharacterized protein BDV14DRAFT_195890 [Aspergillus stella-maris]|uniref:uncharacterized protein n=1 Tax=Aspergillus stella-maris TaxID=1810926 RepID=UPI003CCDF798
MAEPYSPTTEYTSNPVPVPSLFTDNTFTYAPEPQTNMGDSEPAPKDNLLDSEDPVQLPYDDDDDDDMELDSQLEHDLDKAINCA